MRQLATRSPPTAKEGWRKRIAHRILQKEIPDITRADLFLIPPSFVLLHFYKMEA